METISIYCGGWFGDKQTSTGASRSVWLGDKQTSTATSSCLNGLAKYVVAAGLLVSAGTGVFADDLSRARRERNNVPIAFNNMAVYTVSDAVERTPAEEVVKIRRVLSPAVSDLAKACDVSRQTVYNWLNGEQPKAEHAARLKDLSQATELFVGAGISVNSVMLKRKIVKGKNLFEIVREGGSAQAAAHLLVQIVRNEASQRERLATRFAGRRVSQASADSDLMAANDEV